MFCNALSNVCHFFMMVLVSRYRVSVINTILLISSGAYEPPKDHETCTTCWVPSQSKFIAKYFPYKESKILLFEAIYRMHVTTKQQWQRFVYNWGFCVNCRRLFFLTGVIVLTSTFCCTASHSYLIQGFDSITQNPQITYTDFQISWRNLDCHGTEFHAPLPPLVAHKLLISYHPSLHFWISCIPEIGIHCSCVSVISLDPPTKSDTSVYSAVVTMNIYKTNWYY